MASEEKKSAGRHQRGNTIELTTILMDVLRQWWVILLAGLIAGLLYGTYSMYSYTPRYSASTVFVVRSSSVSGSPISENLNAAVTMTDNFTTIVNSSILKRRVCQELGLSSLNASIQVSAVESSNLMTLSVSESSPQLTYAIICSVMDVAGELCGELTDNISISVLQRPAIPTANTNPLDLSSAMTKAALVGALAMTALFAFMSYYKDTVKTENDVKSKVDCKLMGVIPHERKYKTIQTFFRRKAYSMRIDNPTLSFSYVGMSRLTATRVRMAMDQKDSKVLMVTSVTENEGKSTVAANLALSLIREGKKVVLLDCDFFKPAQYKIFGIKKKTLDGYDFGEALRNHSTVRLRQAGLGRKLLVAFSVAPCSNILHKKETEYLEQILNTLRGKADYIIVDSSPFGLVAESETIAAMADACVLVVAQNVVESRYINDTIDQLNGSSGNVIGCIFNNVYPSILGRAASSSTPYGYGYGYRYGYKHGYGYGAYSRKSDGSNTANNQAEE